MSSATNKRIADEQETAQAAAREALLNKIASMASSVGHPVALRNIAEAYALVVAPERSTVSASAESKS